MSLPRVAVGSLGGTITMTAGPDSAGVTPTLRAEDLVAAIPAVGRAARVDTATLASLPGASLSFADVLTGLEWADSAVAGGAVGVVLVQGTDTLEETSYLLDLLWDRPEPVVLTGAMRSAQAPGADGPANLLAAVLTAASPESRSLGALLVMNDEIHAAARVRKSDATRPDTFRSPNFGPLGRVREGAVVYGNRPRRWPHLPRPDAGAEPRVALIETCLGDDAGLLRLVLDEGYDGVGYDGVGYDGVGYDGVGYDGVGYDGVVIAAFGAGHVPRRLAEVVGATAARVPIVYASRTGAGATLSRTYAFVGSESDLAARGAIAAGWLDPRKARILLWALLSGRASRQTIEAEFARRGGSPGGPDAAGSASAG